MTGTEFADFLRDTSMLCRATAHSDVSLLFTFAALAQKFCAHNTAGDAEVAACFVRAAGRYGVSDDVLRAAARAWTDRFGQGGGDGAFDRYSVSQGRG